MKLLLFITCLILFNISLSKNSKKNWLTESWTEITGVKGHDIGNFNQSVYLTGGKQRTFGGFGVWHLSVKKIKVLGVLIRTEYSWERYASIGGVSIAVDIDLKPWIVNKYQEVIKLTKTKGWQRVPGAANDIAIGPQNQVWKIGSLNGRDGPVYKYLEKSNSWQKIGWHGNRIAVDKDGQPWVVDSFGRIFRRQNNKFVRLEGRANDIGISTNGDVWIVSKKKVTGGFLVKKYNFKTQQWEKDAKKKGGVRIAVDEKGCPWILDKNGKIFTKNI